MLKNQLKNIRYLTLAFASFMTLSTVSMASSSTADEFLAIGDTAVEKKCAAQVRLALNLNPTDKIPLNRINDVKFLSFELLDATLPAWLAKFTGLLGLTVQNSNLHTLPEWIGGFKRLSFLRLSVCQLTDLPASLSQLPLLNEIWLSGNKFAKVPPVIATLKSLEHLGLSNMNMREEGLNGTLAALPRLKTFSLALTGASQNGLKIHNLDVSHTPTLLEIKLRNQGIAKLIGIEKLPYFNGAKQPDTPAFVDAGGCPLDQTWFKGLPPVVQKKFGGF